MSQFNGVTPEAKLMAVDIRYKNGKYFFPSNIKDLYEPMKMQKCFISLNAWTLKDPLMTKAIDSIALENPEITMIFPSVKDKKGLILPPGDSKNIISIGSFYGNPASLSHSQTGTPVLVQDASRRINIIGYTDPMGSPLMKHPEA